LSVFGAFLRAPLTQKSRTSIVITRMTVLGLALQFIYTRNSFKRPFKKEHSWLLCRYLQFDLLRKVNFANVIGDYNLSIGARITSPNYA
jgi:hypothetical protein